MSPLLGFVFALLCLQVAEFSDLEEQECVIDLECEECLPENMPRVTSHEARGGRVRVPRGAQLALACGGAFLAYPLRAALAATCEAGRFRVTHDGALRALLELGCRESVYEDAQHAVAGCTPPRQGRAYLAREAAGPRHLAALCYDPERALPAWLRVSAAPLELPPHSDERSPLSLLANFDRAFDASARLDAERLYSDEARLTRRARELLKAERFSLGDQALTSAALLAREYFPPQHPRAGDFPTNRAAVWRGVAAGNLRRVRADVAARLARARGAGEALEVFAGTHGALALGGAELRLRAGRVPVPRYLWTVVLDRARSRGAALVLLNDPFVAVSELRAAVFCESACAALPWLRELARHRSGERPLAGLVFCCALPAFADAVPEMPRVFNSTVQLLV